MEMMSAPTRRLRELFYKKRAGMIFQTYNRPGSMRVRESDTNRAVLETAHYAEMDEIIESRIAGWIERTVEISGNHAVNVKYAKSLLRYDGDTGFTVIWIGNE